MVFNNNLLLGVAGQGGAATFDSTLIGNSVWLNGSDEDIKREGFTLSSDGQKEFIISMWVNFNEFGRAQQLFIIGNPTGITSFNDGTQSTLNADHTITLSIGNGGSSGGQIKTNRVFRDIGWYHLLFSFNSNTSVTSTDRLQLYVNGIRESSLATNTAVPDNQDVRGSLTGNVDLRFGRNTHPALNYFYKGYYAQLCYLEGKSIQAGDFAVSDFLDTFTMGTNGSQFIPKKNSEIAALATSASDNNKDFTATNMASANQSGNTPSKVYATFNPLAQVGTSTGTLSEGNTKLALASDNGVTATKTLPSSGMWYWEIDWSSGANGIYPGIALQSAIGNDGSSPHARSDTFVWLAGDSTGRAYNGSSVVSYVGSATSTGRIAVAFDADNTAMYFGTISSTTITWLASGNPTSGSSKTGAAPFSLPTDETLYIFHSTGNASTAQYLFDEDDWTGSTNRPAGAKSLNSANLTAPEYQGIDYFDATIYEGNGTGQRVGDFVPYTDVGTISQSVAFNAADEDELRIANSVSTSPTNVQKKTVSCWLKPLEARENWICVGNGGSDNSERIYADSTGKLQYLTRSSGSSPAYVQTTGAFLADSSQWVHVVFGLDYTSGSTAADRVKIYVNGIRITDLSQTTYPADNMTAQAYINKASTEQIIGCHPDYHAAADHSNMYYAEYFMVDGHQLDASVFGELDTSTNKWVPKASSTVTTAIGALSGGFGNCGFYLDFSNTSDYVEDDSGNNRDWTEGGVLDATNQFADTPSKNFPTFDPTNNGAGTLSEGNTKIVSSTDQRTTYTNMVIPSTGKWYWEVDATNYVSNGGSYFGVVPASTPLPTNNPSNGFTDQVVFSTYNGDSNFLSNSPNGGTTWCNTPGNNNFVADGDVLQFALDQDAGTFFIGNNNTWYRAGGARDTFANATTVAQGLMPTGIPRRFIYGRGGSFAETYELNFGQKNGTFSGSSTTFNAAADGYFVYTPPTDYKALNQDNLDDTASKITAWAWIKNRDATDSHVLVDRVRGVGVEVHTDGTTTTPETTNTNTVQRFLQRGVQVGSDVQVNTANESYVLWQWLVGDSATTGSSIGAGSISTGVPSLASTALVADAGHFSVVTWTGSETAGATVGHGMGGEPEFIIAIARAESGENKPVYHTFMTSDNDHLKINENNAQGTAGTTIWDVSAMSSTLIGLGAAVQSNSNNGMVAYCFRSVSGVCKIGRYTGNGSSTAGPYVSLGFKPRWIMLKNASVARDWVIVDTARTPINTAEKFLFPNLNIAEAARGSASGSDYDIDVLADAFRPLTGDSALNGDGNTILYMAMADLGGNGTLPPIYGR